MFSSLFACKISRAAYFYFTDPSVNLFPDVDEKSIKVQCSNLVQLTLHEETYVQTY